MRFIRSLLFNILFIAYLIFVLLVFVPALAGPWRWTFLAQRTWGYP